MAESKQKAASEPAAEKESESKTSSAPSSSKAAAAAPAPAAAAAAAPAAAAGEKPRKARREAPLERVVRLAKVVLKSKVFYVLLFLLAAAIGVYRVLQPVAV